MKIFQSLQSAWSLVGVQPHEQNHKGSFGVKSAMAFFFLGKFTISLMVAFWLETRTFNEYAEFSYAILTAGAVIGNLLITTLQKHNLLSLINNLESTIKKREFPANLCNCIVVSYRYC